MTQSNSRFIRSVVILIRNPLAAAQVLKLAQEAFRNPTVAVFHEAFPAIDFLKQESCDLAIVGMETDDSDCLDFVPEILSSGLARHLIVLADRGDDRTLAYLRQCGVDAIVDAFADADLTAALRLDGDTYPFISPSLQPAMKAASTRFRSYPLVEQEQMFLSLFGAGFDNEDLSTHLGVPLGTVKSHRERIMSRLSLQRRGDLTQYATYYRFTRITHIGALFPGFQKRISDMLAKTGLMMPARSCVLPVTWARPPAPAAETASPRRALFPRMVDFCRPFAIFNRSSWSPRAAIASRNPGGK